MWINSPWENYETPKVLTPEQITEEACKKQKEAFQESLNSALQKWIEIQNEEWFTRFQSMIKENLNIDLWNIWFSQLNNGTGIFIKAEKEDKNQLWVYNLNNPLVYGTNLVKLGVIQWDKFNEYNWIYKFVIAPRETRVKEENYSLPVQEEKCEVTSHENTQKESNTPVFTDEKKEVILPIAQDKKHEIKKWESLWKIVESYYDVSGSENKHRDIANIILKLNRLPENKWVIQNNGAIFIWKTLHLPHTITTTRKWGDEKDFSLKNQETQ